MMYKEFEKYKTGTTKEVGYDIHGSNPPSKVFFTEHDLIIPLGDYMHDFIKHMNTPWWRRKSTHNLITKEYVRILNIVKLSITK